VYCCVVFMAKMAGSGVTAIDVGALDTTVSEAAPLTPLTVAVMVTLPTATAVASPEELIVATEVFDDVQAADALTLAVVPLLYVAVAVYCCVAPAAMLAVAGVTARTVIVGGAAVTVTAAVALTPSSAAVIVAEPAATPVTSPAALTVAVDELDEVQVTKDVTVAVVPLL
jgi:hypothetical protein